MGSGAALRMEGLRDVSRCPVGFTSRSEAGAPFANRNAPQQPLMALIAARGGMQ